MLIRRVSAVAVIAVLGVAIGGAAGAEANTADRAAEVAVVDVVQQDPGEIIVGLIQFTIALVLLDAGEAIMNAAIAAGAAFLWLWQIGKNVWDAACTLGTAAEQLLPLPKPYFVFVCTLYPRWPY